MTTPQSHEALIAELRAALIACGRSAGALLADDVSNDFLMFVPGEVKAKIEALSRPTVAREIAQPDYDKLGLGDPEGRN